VITIAGMIFIWQQTSRDAFARITLSAPDLMKIFFQLAPIIILK
jgi:hypothetical protein